MTYQDIEGWFDFEQLYDEQVNRALPGARFVEVGAWLGKSTAYMAQRIKDSQKTIEFNVVDSWDNDFVTADNGTREGGAYSYQNNGRTKEKFHENMVLCGVSDIVKVYPGKSCEMASKFEDESLDFVFIDGDHRAESVFEDCKAWWTKLKPGGLLAGHDFDESGPKRGATSFGEQAQKACYGDGIYTRTGYRCFGIPKPTNEERNIFLAIPHYDGTVLAPTLITACAQAYSGNGYTAVKNNGTSALCNNFNSLWCEALNTPGITHFAMVHADIMPMPYWLNVLMREMEQEQAQLISTVVPIKDHQGVTSTGIALKEHHWTAKRRFTMTELMNMPSTFDAARAGYPDHHLVVNTGCWMADLRDDRWHTTNPNGSLVAHFEMNDMVKKMPNGFYQNFFEPEDFYFSRKAQELGMRVVATRKPQITHIGVHGYQNEGAWGTFKTDLATRPYWDEDAKDEKQTAYTLASFAGV